jgi:hypothetical protein
MTDALSEYRTNPMLWCAMAVLELNQCDVYDDGQCEAAHVKLLVQDTMEFITYNFEEEQLPVPTADEVLKHTLKRVQQLRS